MAVALALLLSPGCDFSGCPECGGQGRIKCTLCAYGKQDCAVCVDGVTDSGRPCTFCKGAGRILCQGCRGEGSVSCPSCRGTGRR